MSMEWPVVGWIDCGVRMKWAHSQAAECVPSVSPKLAECLELRSSLEADGATSERPICLAGQWARESRDFSGHSSGTGNHLEVDNVAALPPRTRAFVRRYTNCQSCQIHSLAETKPQFFHHRQTETRREQLTWMERPPDWPLFWLAAYD